MYNLPKNEDCDCECNDIPYPEELKTEEYLRMIYKNCIKRVNLRGLSVRPCYKLVILSKEWADQYRYENKYFMFRN